MQHTSFVRQSISDARCARSSLPVSASKRAMSSLAASKRRVVHCEALDCPRCTFSYCGASAPCSSSSSRGGCVLAASLVAIRPAPGNTKCLRMTWTSNGLDMTKFPPSCRDARCQRRKKSRTAGATFTLTLFRKRTGCLRRFFADQGDAAIVKFTPKDAPPRKSRLRVPRVGAVKPWLASAWQARRVNGPRAFGRWHAPGSPLCSRWYAGDAQCRHWSILRPGAQRSHVRPV